MQVPLLSGVVGTEQAEFKIAYPTNCEPLAIDNKISRGQLRATSGAVTGNEGPGTDRGGIFWNNKLYRIMGTWLVSVDAQGEITQIGEVGGEGQCRLDYSFDRLIIRSSLQLWYYDGTNLTQVIDEDLGQVVDCMWIDGYTMTTDGTYIIVTELSDPFSVLPLKYGSAEEDPDPIVKLLKIRDEAQIIGRNTIQPFRNVGGNGFPFVPQEGATIPYGCVGSDAACLFAATFAFVGSGRNEGLRVFIAGNGDAQPISTRTVEDALAAVVDPAAIIIEARAWRGEQRLLVHLPGETWVYCAEASLKVQQPIWYKAQSGVNEPYRIRNAVLAYGKTFVGDLNSSNLGLLSDDVDTHFGELAQWQFDVGLIYGEGKGGVLHSAELVGLPGRGSDENPTIFMSWTKDAETFSMERPISMGKPGERRKRIVWRPHIRFPNYIGLRFRGMNRAMPGFARCECEIEAMV